jgi:hypothetical protein
MSTNLSNAFIAQFDAEVKQAYQGIGKIRPTIRTKTGVVGSTHRFPKIGKGLASPRVPQTDVVPMNIAHTNATATLEDWNAPEYTDIFDQAKVNFDERQELAQVVGGAISRRMDQLIIDAADAGANATQVPTSVGATVGLNVDKLRRAKRLLDEKGVPSEDRYFVHSAIALEQLLNETEATSADFNTVRALVNGQIDTYLGFKFLIIEDRAEAGLPVTGANVRTCFAYHKQALGLAVGMEMNTKIDWVPEKTSWLINGKFSAGSVAIDDEGVYEVLVDES